MARAKVKESLALTPDLGIFPQLLQFRNVECHSRMLLWNPKLSALLRKSVLLCCVAIIQF